MSIDGCSSAVPTSRRAGRRLLLPFPLVLVLLPGCDRGRSPTGPIVSRGWSATPSLLSFIDPPGCGFRSGDIHEGSIHWQIVETAGSIEFKIGFDTGVDDPAPTYVGVREGDQFTATNESERGPWRLGSCEGPSRAADLAGAFSADGLRFEAVESLVWRLHDGEEVKLELRWRGMYG